MSLVYLFLFFQKGTVTVCPVSVEELLVFDLTLIPLPQFIKICQLNNNNNNNRRVCSHINNMIIESLII